MAEEARVNAPAPGEPAKQPAAAGSLPADSAAGKVASADGRRMVAGRPAAQAIALVVAGLTLVLLFVGGIVTSSGAGMSVPDWPTSFGHNMFALPFDLWKGDGVAIEHTHRLIATTVGILAILAVGICALYEPRRGVLAVAGAVLVVVSIQGVLGGYRVLLQEHGLAAIHGCFAQLVFAVMAAFVTVSGAGWISSRPLEVPAAALRSARTKAWVIVGLCYLQVLLGAWYRHFAAARIEPHAMNAIVLLALAGMTTKSVKRLAPDRRWLLSSGKLLNMLLGVQLLLGVVALVAKKSAVHLDVKLGLVSLHIVLGALALGSAVAFALKLHRDLGDETTLAVNPDASPSQGAAPGSSGPLAGATS